MKRTGPGLERPVIEGHTEKLIDPFGEIRSPSLFSDGIYPRNSNCTWEIEVDPDEVGKMLKFVIII